MAKEELTLNLTKKELTKYNSKKVDEKDLPKVYSISTQSSVPISRDMEAFLILEDFDFKSTMVDVINTNINETVTTQDEEKALFDEAWKNEEEITRNEIADLNSKLSFTSDVKSKLRNSKFVNVRDINELLTSVSSEQNYLGVRQRVAQFHLVYLNQFKTKYQSEENTNEENVKAAKSWLNALKSY